jgi:hypothetical protein
MLVDELVAWAHADLLAAYRVLCLVLYWREHTVVQCVRDPSVWNLDLWTARAQEFAPTRTLRAAWMSAMTEDARSCILAIKEALCREPKYGRSLAAMHIYEAVLGRGRRTTGVEHDDS